MGQLRFCLRADIDAPSCGDCQIEEIPRTTPSPGDIVMFAKTHIADDSPCKVVVVMTQARAASLRNGFVQPSGVARRREIAEKLQKNIASYAPRCQQQGIITHDAAAYLQEWSQGRWPRQPRPRGYPVLAFRQRDLPGAREGANALPDWSVPRPMRRIKLADDVRDSDEELEEDNAEGAVGLD